mmetsp:Transcript_1340/g.3429  ORF Transcript_1340/g.3429 Transcript_1340/m.3429 type:complete len:170 (-) Transcript_1340:386-895(-)
MGIRRWWLVVLAMQGCAGFAPPAPSPRRGVAMKSAPAKIVEMAQQQTSNLRQALKSAPAPAELTALEASLAKGASAEDLGREMMLLLVSMTLDHVQDVENDSMSPVESPGAPLDPTPEVKAKMQYLYSYGIRMMTSGLIDLETLQAVVVDKVAPRVGMSGEELDAWLDM